jgi:predicted HTH transcriptional regulator
MVEVAGMLAQTICAMANSEGGCIYLGVARSGHVVGF